MKNPIQIKKGIGKKSGKMKRKKNFKGNIKKKKEKRGGTIQSDNNKRKKFNWDTAPVEKNSQGVQFNFLKSVHFLRVEFIHCIHFILFFSIRSLLFF